MTVKMWFFEFLAPYHVGWRKPERIIDHFTLVRALTSIAVLSGDKEFLEMLKEASAGNYEFMASALLLAAPTEGGMYRLLAPFPSIPATFKPSKLGVYWITLSALKPLVNCAHNCIIQNSWPLLVDTESSSGERIFRIKCFEKSSWCNGEFRSVGGVLYLSGDDNVASSPSLELVTEYRNSIDRVTGSADLFTVAGYKPSSLLWFAIKSDKEDLLYHVDSLLTFLEETGIGGYRSRGWGRFRLVEASVDDGDLRVLEQYTGWVVGRLHAALASVYKGYDPDRSFGFLRVIAGVAGPPFDEHQLPAIRALDVGSLVYARDPSPTYFEELETSVGSLIFFSPLCIVGGE
jgi:hypothetical protein